MFRNSILNVSKSIFCHIQNRTPLLSLQKRSFVQIVTGTEKCSTPHSRGLVLGVYANEEDKLDIGCLTEVATKYNEVY